MRNPNAIDPHDNVHLGHTEKGEDVEVCRSVAEADLVIYFNINYAAMDGGYKSYATGLVSHRSLRHNHDSQTLRHTRSAVTLLAMLPEKHSPAQHRPRRGGRRHDVARMKAHRLLHPPFQQSVHELVVRPYS